MGATKTTLNTRTARARLARIARVIGSAIGRLTACAHCGGTEWHIAECGRKCATCHSYYSKSDGVAPTPAQIELAKRLLNAYRSSRN